LVFVFNSVLVVYKEKWAEALDDSLDKAKFCT
jgi:hypothetical protein